MTFSTVVNFNIFAILLSPVIFIFYRLRQSPLVGYGKWIFEINKLVNSKWVNEHYQIAQTVVKRHPLYIALPDRLKNDFEHRVFTLSNILDISGLNYERRIQLVADAVHLTYGHPKYHFPALDEIVVVKSFRNRGDVYLSKSKLVFSYDFLARGWANHQDGDSTSYYGLALTLYKGITKYNQDDPLLTQLQKEWKDQITALSPTTTSGKIRLLKLRGDESPQQIFCLTCEAFCESPQALKELHPAIYDLVARFLNFDPLQLEHHEITYNEHVAFREQRRKAIPQTFIGGAGCFTAILLYLQTRNVEIQMSLMLASVALIFALQLGWYRYILKQSFLAKTTMLFRLGLSIIIANLFFAVNNNFFIENTMRTERYTLTGYTFERIYTYDRTYGRRLVNYEVELQLETDRFNKYPHLLKYNTSDLPNLPEENTVIYEFQRGLLGLRVRTGIAISY